MPRGKPVETPRRKARGRAEDIVTPAEQRAKETGADKTAGAENQDGTLEPPDFPSE